MVVTPDDIQSAENRMLEETYPEHTEEQRQMQPKFLAQFATSAAFSETSRLGSFCFSFTLREVLDAYREQETDHMIWKAEAMCDTHRYCLMRDDIENKMTAEPWKWFPQYFVWDNITLAFHLGDEVLTFDSEKLRDSLTISSPASCKIEPEVFDRPSALRIVQQFWPEYQEAREEPDQGVEERGRGANTEAEEENGEEEN
ncbi:hypothetical protein D4764_14G0005240 [Takifugu flavidus]|uniref:Uncharacterized protein n=1 Tax=Takifugu flavidus TaxID=433684 RepID=A0A5C6P6S8_9TELE|nr:hypothetical protein D4764_14G0005240 [Takifugu flavidus]